MRCLLPLASGRFLHLFVLYGYQGADSDAEQLSLTEQLFDAALGELSVVARDFNVEPTKNPCLSKGISAGLWVDLDAAWSAAKGQQPAVTCKRSWVSTGGSRRNFCWLVARWLLLLCSPVLCVLAGGGTLTLLFSLRWIVKGGLAG